MKRGIKISKTKKAGLLEKIVTAGAALLFGIAWLGTSSPGCALSTYHVEINSRFSCAKKQESQKYCCTDAHDALESEDGLGLTEKDKQDFDSIVRGAVDAVLKAHKNMKLKTPLIRYSRTSASEVMQTIDDVMKYEGFRKVEHDVRLLNQALKSKELDCDTALLMYSAIAQILDIPFAAVREPKHIFFRWRLPDGDFLDWEPMDGKRVYHRVSVTKTGFPFPLIVIRKDEKKEEAGSTIYGRGISSKDALALHYASIGMVWRKKRKLKKALHFYEKAYSANPNDPVTRNCKGFADMMNRRNESAIERFSEAIMLDPEYKIAFLNRGVAYLTTNEYDHAILDFKKFLEFDPDNCKAHYLVGVAFFRKGEYRKAADNFRRSYSINPKNRNILESLNTALEKERTEGKPEKKEKLLTKAEYR